MRMIDADALKANLESTEEKEYTTTGYILHMCDSLQIIDASPTIDAIPVEWLEKKRENLILAAMVHSTVYGDNSIELCNAVNVVLDMWQKEQEAR